MKFVRVFLLSCTIIFPSHALAEDLDYYGSVYPTSDQQIVSFGAALIENYESYSFPDQWTIFSRRISGRSGFSTGLSSNMRIGFTGFLENEQVGTRPFRKNTYRPSISWRPTNNLSVGLNGIWLNSKRASFSTITDKGGAIFNTSSHRFNKSMQLTVSSTFLVRRNNNDKMFSHNLLPGLNLFTRRQLLPGAIAMGFFYIYLPQTSDYIQRTDGEIRVETFSRSRTHVNRIWARIGLFKGMSLLADNRMTFIKSFTQGSALYESETRLLSPALTVEFRNKDRFSISETIQFQQRRFLREVNLERSSRFFKSEVFTSSIGYLVGSLDKDVHFWADYYSPVLSRGLILINTSLSSRRNGPGELLMWTNAQISTRVGIGFRSEFTLRTDIRSAFKPFTNEYESWFVSGRHLVLRNMYVRESLSVIRTTWKAFYWNISAGIIF